MAEFVPVYSIECWLFFFYPLFPGKRLRNHQILPFIWLYVTKLKWIYSFSHLASQTLNFYLFLLFCRLQLVLIFYPKQCILKTELYDCSSGKKCFISGNSLEFINLFQKLWDFCSSVVGILGSVVRSLLENESITFKTHHRKEDKASRIVFNGSIVCVSLENTACNLDEKS